MKRFLRIFAVAFALIMLVMGVACKEGGGNESNAYTVTFSLNYEGAQEPYKKVEVSEDEDGFTLVEEPQAPTRDNYTFGGWFKESECTTPVNFENNIENDVTYYAKWTMSAAIVTFDSNYEGGDSTAVTVKIGEQVSQPVSPARDGYIFDAWYTESECINAFDFSTEIKNSLTLYAGWDEISGEGTVTITYKYNYDGAPNDGVYDARKVAYNKKTTAPNITRSGYMFDGWYTEAACETAFDFNSRVTQDHTLYAKWLKTYTFEAEMTDLSAFNGYGYSGAITGWNAVYADRYNANASNGYYVTGLYDKGLSLTFCVYAEEETDDAYLALNLSGEFQNFSLTDEEFLITVNGKKVSFGSFTFNIDNVSDGNKLPFKEYLSTNRIHLDKGENTVVLTTNNNTKGMGGTVYALAPMVDCIRVYSSQTIGWDTAKGFPLDTYKEHHTS